MSPPSHGDFVDRFSHLVSPLLSYSPARFFRAFQPHLEPEVLFFFYSFVYLFSFPPFIRASRLGKFGMGYGWAFSIRIDTSSRNRNAYLVGTWSFLLGPIVTGLFIMNDVFRRP